MKKLKTAFLSAALTAVMAVSASAVDLYIDWNKIDTDVPPTAVSGRTLVPMRAIFESLGCTVDWNGTTQTATGVRDDVEIVIPLGSETAYVNGEPWTLDVPAQAINGRTMVPARFVGEALNCVVTWHAPTQTAAVADEMRDQGIYVTQTGDRYHYDSTCNGGTYYAATLAEATGRGLTPCEKCIGVVQTDPVTPIVPVTPVEPVVPVQPEPDPEPQPENIPGEQQGQRIYVTKSGKRYHHDGTCNGGTYYESTMEDALRRGLTPCEKCVQ